MASSFKDRMLQRNTSNINQTLKTIEAVSQERQEEAVVIEEKVSEITKPDIIPQPVVIKESIKPVEKNIPKADVPAEKDEMFQKSDIASLAKKPMSAAKCVALTKDNFKKIKINASRNGLSISNYLNVLLEREAALYNTKTGAEKKQFLDELFDICDEKMFSKDKRLAFTLSEIAYEYCDEIVKNSGVKFTSYVNYVVNDRVN